MVDVARRRGAELGLGNVDYRLMDAERIELDADSVDGVLCRFGYMLMPDPAAALAEARRVLRPGGRLALAVWGAPERNPWVTLGLGQLVERGHLPAPDPCAPSAFALASAQRTRALLEAAGFTSVRTEEIPVRFTFRDLDEYRRVHDRHRRACGTDAPALAARRARRPHRAAPCGVRPLRDRRALRAPGLALSGGRELRSGSYQVRVPAAATGCFGSSRTTGTE